ncbi:MAG: ShlB/FhaC/HecB family hemolysin secretion/activation protein [Burkholderiales bacterium]
MAADLPPATPDAPPAAIVAAAPAEAAPINVDANDFVFSVVGNTLLPREDVEALLRDAKSPKEAVEGLERAYREAGYLFVVVGGQVNNRLVAIRVLQGRISELEAPDALLPFLRRIVGRDDLTRRDFVRTTAMIDLFTARQGTRAKAEFAKAEQVGGTRLTVVEEPVAGAQPWNAGLAFGNLGSRFSSRYTASATGALRPGGGLELTAGYTQGLPGLTGDSAGSSYRAAQLGASLVTPWGLYSLAYSKTQYRIGERTAPLYPSGDIETGGLTGTQLVYADDSSRLALTESLIRVSNVQTVFDGLTTLTDQNYTYASIGASYSRSVALLGQNAALTAGATYQQGLSGRSGSLQPDGPGVPNPRYALGQANAGLSTSLPAGFAASVTVSGQYTEDTLPQNQQWVIGGFGNLTAWLPAVLVGDSGALARLSVNTPAYRWGDFGLSGTAFAEGGLSRYSERPAGDPVTRSLADVGLALTGSATFGLTATLAYAWPVWYRNVSGAVRDSVDSNRANLYFALNQSF